MSDPSDIPRRYGFDDLKGFIDYFAHASLLDEEDFDPPDFVPVELRWTVADVFQGLELGYRLVSTKTGETSLLQECRRLTKEARILFEKHRYEDGRDKLGNALSLIESVAA